MVNKPTAGERNFSCRFFPYPDQNKGNISRIGPIVFLLLYSLFEFIKFTHQILIDFSFTVVPVRYSLNDERTFTL